MVHGTHTHSEEPIQPILCYTHLIQLYLCRNKTLDNLCVCVCVCVCMCMCVCVCVCVCVYMKGHYDETFSLRI